MKLNEYICTLCPRECAALRSEQSGSGFCGMGTLPKVARIAPHFWEEPCISGTKGSGTVFFSGCVLGCVFCQNDQISWSEHALRGAQWAENVSPEELVRTAVRLKARGNIGLAFTYNEPLIGYEYILDTENHKKFRQLTNAIHVYDAKASLELLGFSYHHVEENGERVLLSLNGGKVPETGEVTRKFTLEDLERIADSYGDVAEAYQEVSGEFVVFVCE